MPSIAALPYASRFVAELPGDPSVEPRPRQVYGACYTRTIPTAVRAPELIALVPEVCALLGLDATPTRELAEVLGGNRIVPGMEPYAACYGGHQFGTWAGQLGDGRAITLGEIATPPALVDPHDPFTHAHELQLKGAGPTPYSRRADGRAVLRSSLRELVCSEAMHHLGVPTTRALALVLTGEAVTRDLLYDGNPADEPGAITTRVAPSFVRFGNFELLAARDDRATLRTLFEHVRARFYPGRDLVGFLDEVALRTAWMVAEWMRVGFVHGVMNTDNMSILGLTIDYGPYGWIEPFDLDWTPNTTDASGRRYRFGAQPQIAMWNVAQLGRALARIATDADHPRLQRVIDRFPRTFAAIHRDTSLRKLGLTPRPDTQPDDDDLLAHLGALLTSVPLDYALTFRALARSPIERVDLAEACYGAPPPGLADFLARYAARARREGLADGERRARMDAINPIYVPRNYLVQEVIDATTAGDRAALPALLEVLRAPYVERPDRARYAAKRPAWAEHKPGCAMLSCSS